MVLPVPSSRELRPRSILLAWVLVTLLGVPGTPAGGQPAKKIDVLRIGTSGQLALDESGGQEKGALETLRSFVKSETGFDNEILHQKDWRELTAKLAGGQVHLGVFQGYEFAWAREKNPDLQALAIAVNVYPYRFASVVVRQDNPATDFAGLQGQSLALPRIDQGLLRLFVDQQSRARGKGLEAFFSRVTAPENFEDAVDDVVDGVVQAAAVTRVGLEAYKRRKPGRFNRLKEVARSQPFPPPLVAYYGAVPDPATRQRFQEGLLNARRKERGQRLLTFFRLTGFETPPRDLDRVLAETRKAYPPPGAGAK
jgi:ABC-type phosphate/phosphonate transport system substrate-binding protein